MSTGTGRGRSPTPPPIQKPKVILQIPAAKKIKTDEDKKPESPASLEIVMGEPINEEYPPQPPRPPTPNPESPENLPLLRRSKRLEAIAGAGTSPSSASTSSSSGIASSISSPVSPSSAASSTSSTPSPQGGGRPLRTYYNRRRGMRSGAGATPGTGDSDENPPPDVQQVIMPGGRPGQQGQVGKDAAPASTKGRKPS